ncbi:MAG TPA: rRNA maturation RNase YbeY [Gammaproteobacteria bacterium]|nr:rRNA maturation RNase YbeY [Gammaproteobacteria bacterium]
MPRRKATERGPEAVRLDLGVQIACLEPDGLPGRPALRRWVATTIAAADPARQRAALTLRVVDEAEGRQLNHDWRGGDYATNVLSFPADGVGHVAPELLGDLVLCAPVLAREAAAAGRAADFHWAHLVVHGTLHLLGHTHDAPQEAAGMEALERQVLASLGFPEPYPDDA